MKKTLLAILLFSSANCVLAQYDFETFTAPYVELTDPEAAASAGWDDPEFTISLGFDFSVGDATDNEIVQTGNGAYFTIGDLSSSASFGKTEDLTDAGESTISYSIDGEEGNRICKVQWTECGFFFDDPFPNKVNFQIWLYESDNSIEFRHGSNTVTDQTVYGFADGSQVLIETASATEQEFMMGYSLEGDPQNPEFIASDEEFLIAFVTLDGTPSDGRVYRFTPQPLSSRDVEEVQYSVFPSPADDFIQINGEVNSGDLYRITDITGKVVSQGVFTDNAPIDVSELTNGIYLISFANARATCKFLKK